MHDEILIPVNILLVDDRPENLMSLEIVLEELNVNIFKALSGREALKMVMDEEFCLILMDVNMPEMDGIETARLIRERFKTIPIIFITAEDVCHESTRKGFELGAVDFIFKPLDTPKIICSKINVFIQLFETMKRERILLEQMEQRSYQRIAGAGPMSIVSSTYEGTPLNMRDEFFFSELVDKYCHILEKAVEKQVLKINYDISENVKKIALELGKRFAKPSDLVSLHREALIRLASCNKVDKMRYFKQEGSFLLLELMGELALFYRNYFSGFNNGVGGGRDV